MGAKEPDDPEAPLGPIEFDAGRTLSAAADDFLWEHRVPKEKLEGRAAIMSRELEEKVRAARARLRAEDGP